MAADDAQAKSPTGASQREDQLHVYAALGVSTSLTGGYSDLRRMIEAIERSRQFIIIDSIAFQGETTSSSSRNVEVVPAGPAGGVQPGVPAPGQVPNRAQPPKRSATGGKPDGGNELLVSLKVEMETYFRRSN